MSHSVVFLGTPALAAPFLEAIVAAGFQVPVVITQPDQPAGRGHTLTPPPVKVTAQRLGLPVRQMEKFNDPTLLDELRTLKPELFVVVAFGAILPQEVLDIPRHGCVNMHASLLPAYRGASPIPAVILNGESTTGWTVMLMDAGLDTGPILTQQPLTIDQRETSISLTAKLAATGPELCVHTISRYLDGQIESQPQSNEGVSLTKRIAKTAGLLDWQKPAAILDRHIRAYQPWPGGYTFWDGRKLEITEAEVGTWTDTSAPPGSVVTHDKELGITTGQGVLVIHQLKPAGKSVMSALDFMRGRPQFLGARLG